MPAALLCAETAIISIIHIFAFPVEKRTDSETGRAQYHGGFAGFNAVLDALNPTDLVKALARGVRWLFVTRKHRHHDISYKLGTVNHSPSMSMAAAPNDHEGAMSSSAALVNKNGVTVQEEYDLAERRISYDAYRASYS